MKSTYKARQEIVKLMIDKDTTNEEKEKLEAIGQSLLSLDGKDKTDWSILEQPVKKTEPYADCEIDLFDEDDE